MINIVAESDRFRRCTQLPLAARVQSNGRRLNHKKNSAMLIRMFGRHNFPRKKLIPARSRALIFSAPWIAARVISSGAPLRPKAGAPTMRVVQSGLRTPREFDGWSARGAQPVSQTGARPRKARGRPDRKGSPKGGLANPLAPSRRSIPHVGKTEKGKTGVARAVTTGPRSVG